MRSFLEITEATEKHAVLAYGRLNPPTTGHAKLVDKVHEIAQTHKATHSVVLSNSVDPKKNPLSQGQKIKHAQRFFPKTNIVAADKQLPTIFHHAANAHKEGVLHLHVVAGDDRVKHFQDSLNKYNGHFDKDGNGYKFKSITVHSAGKRDDNAKGTEGMSASKMRDHATKGNFAEFKKGVPSHVKHEHAKELYDEVRKGQSLKEETDNMDYLSEGVHDASIFKAVFLAGAPGSGKDFVLKKALEGHGFTEINSDKALEHLMAKASLDKKMPEHEQERRNVVRDRAKSMTELRQRLAIHGRNGLIINSTGASHVKLKKLKDMLSELGYDNKMIFVDASDNVSRNRNVERGQRGGRMIPEKIRSEKWREAQDARVKFAELFGGEHYHEFNNDEDLRHNTDPEVHSQKSAELDGLHKTVRKFAQTPVKSAQAQQWIHTNMGKLAKMPVGNTKQQANVIPPHPESRAKREADGLGLKYMGHGRYGKDGRVTHYTLHDRLIEKQKALKPPVKKVETVHDLNNTKSEAKKLNEEFTELFMEDMDHGTTEMVREIDAKQYFSDAFQGHRGDRSNLANHSGFVDLADCQEEVQEETSQEGSQGPKDFHRFRQGLVVSSSKEIQESSPVVDTMETGGPILGGGPSETNDMSKGGLSTSVPKKTLKQVLRGNK